MTSLRFKVLVSVFFAVIVWLFALSGSEEKCYLEHIHRGLVYQRNENRCHHLTDQEIAGLDSLFLELYRKEQDLKEEYYQVVSAQNSIFIAFQVIIKEIYYFFDHYDAQDFEWLRSRDERLYTDLEEFFCDYPDLLKLNEKNSHYESDAHPEVGNHLISASLSMETCLNLESAQYFFSLGKGVNREKEQEALIFLILSEALKKRGISQEIADKYLKVCLEGRPSSSVGILNQIFIPKKHAQNLLYASASGGYCLIEETENLEAFFNDYDQKRQAKDFDIFNGVQVRLLADGLRSGEVKIFRYSTISEEKMDAYKKIVKQAIERMFEEVNVVAA